MVRKTIVREVYSKKHIPIDPAKLDDDYQHFAEREVEYAQAEIDAEAADNANTTPIDIPQALPEAPIEVDMTTNSEPATVLQEQPTPLPATGAYEVPDF